MGYKAKLLVLNYAVTIVRYKSKGKINFQSTSNLKKKYLNKILKQAADFWRDFILYHQKYFVLRIFMQANSDLILYASAIFLSETIVEKISHVFIVSIVLPNF